MALLLSGSFDTANAQPRPVLRYARREYLAGNFVLLPRAASLHTLALPKQLVPLADHQLHTPPQSALADSAALLRWAQSFDYAETDGALLTLDALPTGNAVSTWLKNLRASRPNLPLYATVTAERATAALELVESGLLDFLLVAPAASELLNQIAQRRWQDRVALGDTAETAALLLQTRLLNQRFGFAPRVGLVFSGAPTPALRQALRAQINLLGGSEAGQNERADLYLFVHTPQTAPPALSAFANTLEKAATDGARCALLDLSGTPEALLNNLRARKLLDRLASYAATSAAPQAESKAAARALTQAATWLISIKFLRDDVERLRRTERTQVALLLGSYLRDWAYPAYVQPKLENFVRNQPPAQRADAEAAETFALGELKPHAEKLFAEQFKRNIHAVLLASDERAEFEITLLQRLQIRLAPKSLGEPEIRLALNLAHLGNFLPQPAMPRALWDFTNGRGLDERLGKRFDAVDWHVFKTDAEAVEVSVKLNANPQANPEGYALRSRRNGQTRRIEINAATAQGAFYAFGKLEQLGASGQLAQDVNLTETPAYAQRGVVERFADAPWPPRERLEMLRFAGRVRLNRYVYASQFDHWRRERWREDYPNRELLRLEELARAARENFVNVVYALNPGAALDYASEDDFAALTAKLKAVASVGVYEFALGFDDAPPQLQREAERARFKTLAAAQAQLARRVEEWLKGICPTCRLAVVPANPLNSAEQNSYLQELGANLPPTVALIWLGSESFLPDYTRTRLQELTRLTGRPPLRWNHFTAGAQAGLFLGAKRAEAAPLEALGFLAVPPSRVYAARLSLATAAEYAWESRTYNPERALENALALLYDERSRGGMRLWARAFGGAAPTGGGAHANAQAPPLTEEQWNALQTALSTIGTTRERGLLRGELARVLKSRQ